MTWKETEFPIFKGAKEVGDKVEAKRFWKFKLNELLDIDSEICQEFFGGLTTWRQVARKVIERVEYPFRMGLPDDKHTYNAYFGKYKRCWTLTADYWDKVSEVVATLVGDCDGSSIAIVGGCLIIGVEAYQCLGYLYKGDKILGGHAWPIVHDPESDKWYLVESTLDEVPEEYPEIDPETNWWNMNELRYHAWVKFNNTHYYEWIGGSESMGIKEYLKLGRKLKETREKYEAIRRAWRKRVKPLSRMGILERLRWKYEGDKGRS
ncbi:MAG: hypothetical protein DRP01_01570 [Archaeoglobales archaeon]|nr:MAG: hypothetical protein DRP01_01570 [Archaeoglobales archaeon]